MKKVIEISACINCPHICCGIDTCRETAGVNDDGKHIEDNTIIQEWCPLQSPEEYAESNFNIDKKQV
jgi:hypothetical protein